MPNRSHQQRRDVARFDAWSQRYDRSWLQRAVFGPVQAHVVAVATQVAPQAGTVLDVGCGTGRLLERLAHAYPAAHLFGVDAAPGMAQVAARRRRIAAVVGVAERLPFRTGSPVPHPSRTGRHAHPRRAAADAALDGARDVGGGGGDRRSGRLSA
jgi:ubiquinone/menaquinone biosynthesis C-methylase UbiE